VVLRKDVKCSELGKDVVSYPTSPEGTVLATKQFDSASAVTRKTKLLQILTASVQANVDLNL